MKKFLSILMLAVVVSGTAMAVEIEPKRSPGGMAVMKSETGFKLFYRGNKACDVTVKIYDQKGVQVFSEIIKNLDSFIRPYNLNTLNEGEYTVELSNSEGKSTEKVTFSRKEEPRKMMDLVRVKNSDKYLLRVANKGSETLNVKVYDGSELLVYESSEIVSGDFAKLFDLSRIGTKFRFEITDRSGSTQQLSYSK
jgi:hypothetical protein